MKSMISILIIFFTFSVSAEPYTLEQCIQIALENNNSIKQQKYQYESQKINYQQARRNLLPNLNASAGQNWVFGKSLRADNIYQNTNSAQTNLGLSASLILFDGLRMKYAIDEAQAAMQASEADANALKADITMNVSVIYLQVLQNKEIVALTKIQLADTEQRIAQINTMIEAKKIPVGERYLVEAQAAKEELNLVQAQNNLQLSLLDLAQVMELDSIQNFDIVVPTQEELDQYTLLPNNDIYSQAIQNRPEIKSAQLNLSVSENALKIAKSSYYPTLSAGANLGTAYYNLDGAQNSVFGQQLNDNLSTSLGLSLQIPIFNKMATTSNVERAKLNVENYKVEVDNVKKQLRKEIDQAYYNALAAKSREESATKSEKSNNEAFRYAQQKYESGRASVYEMYEAKLNYAIAQSERIQAKYDYLFKVKILEYYATDFVND